MWTPDYTDEWWARHEKDLKALERQVEAQIRKDQIKELNLHIVSGEEV
jgi:hypothetical protein